MDWNVSLCSGYTGDHPNFLTEIFSVHQKEDENIWVTAQHVNLLITPNSQLSSVEYSVLMSASSWSEDSPYRLSLDASDDYTFSMNPPLTTSSRPGCVPLRCDISVNRKGASLAFFSSTTINLSQLPFLCSLLSTSLLIPLFFPVFHFALVTPLIEFGRYLSKTTSTLVHLICPNSEKQQRQ